MNLKFGIIVVYELSSVEYLGGIRQEVKFEIDPIVVASKEVVDE